MGLGRVTMQLRWLRFFAVAAFVAILAAGWWISCARTTGYYLHQGEARAATSLRLTVLGLDRLLRRFRAAPALLAEDPHLAAFLANPADQTTQLAANMWLSEQAELIDAGAVFAGSGGNCRRGPQPCAARQFCRPKLCATALCD